MELPTKVSYTKKDVSRAAAEQAWKDGITVQIVIELVKPFAQPTKGKGPGEDLGFLFKLAVVDPSDGYTKLKNPPIWNRTLLPITHPDYENTHEPPTYAANFWGEHCRGFLGERHKQAPMRDKGVWMFDGEEIEHADVDIAKFKLSEALLDEAVEQWKDQGQEMVGYTAYATIKRNGKYTNVTRLRSELRDETLTPKEDLREYVALNIED